MTEHEIKQKIAYDYSERFRAMYPDPWQYACNVYEHFMSGPQPTNAKWLSQREDYEEYARYF
jgi:hypothetical protein